MQMRWYLTSIGRCYKVSPSGLKRGYSFLKSVRVASHVTEDDSSLSIYGICVLWPKVVVASEESEHRKNITEDNCKPSKHTENLVLCNITVIIVRENFMAVISRIMHLG